MFDVFEGVVDEAIMGVHSQLGLEVPEVFGKGYEGPHHFSLEAPQVLCTSVGYVPRVRCP